MDFVFRGFYQRNSSGSHSSNYTYYTQQANQCDFESYNGGRYDHFLGNRDVMMERQLEKEVIRREILAKEARRRELEAEVMRELREERELELRRRGGDHWEAPHRNCYVERRSYENRIALPFCEKMYDFPRLEEGMIVQRTMYDFPPLEEGTSRSNEEELPFQRAPQAIKSEAKPPSDEEKKQIISLERRYDFPHLKEGKIWGCEKEELPIQRASQSIKTEVKSSLDGFTEGKQIISMAKPNTNHFGKKRKDMSSPVEGPSEVTKKLTKEWSCDLCQISATSEQGLEDHMKGKKHKSKQAGQKAGMIGLCSKKINRPLNPSQVVKSNETGVENNEIDIIMEKGCKGGDTKMPKKKKIKFKFYCKMCEVGAFCEEVMANHKKGKKHLFRLHQLDAKR